MTARNSIVDEIGRHNPGDVGFERAALPPALFLAWCVSLDLASRTFLDSAGAIATRLKMRDVTPSDAFVSACGGELSTDMLSEAAQRFADDHYEQYLEQLAAILADQESASVDGWATYDQVSPWLTRCWFGQRPTGSAAAGGIVATVARWWSSR